MIEPYRSKIMLNVKKAKGILDRVDHMIEQGRYCMDVAQQCNAAIGLLKKANNLILESHLNTCGAEHLGSKNKKVKESFIKELLRVCTVTNRKV